MNLSAGNLLAQIIFGGIGFVAFVYGKKQMDLKVLILGIVLMAYPYFISNTLILYEVGSLLTIALFFWHN